jgi:hypothetical protein
MTGLRDAEADAGWRKAGAGLVQRGASAAQPRLSGPPPHHCLRHPGSGTSRPPPASLPKERNIIFCIFSSVADPNHGDADRDSTPAFHSDADPDLDPTFQFDAGPDPDPTTHSLPCPLKV